MQSNVTVPASGSRFKLWLLIVVLAVAIFGGSAYGYYSWYKSNEPPPSLEAVDGSGLQGLMRIKDGVKEIQGFAKLEEGDVKDCTGGVVELEGETTDYLYSTEEVTYKDIYDSIAIKENIGKMFMFVFYSPGEKVGAIDYKTGFYFFPTSGTNWKAVANVEDKDLANYKIPAYRSVILFHNGAIGICRSGKVGPAVKVDKLSDADNANLEENLDPLPKGWILVPFGWNLDNVMILKGKLGDYVNSMWFRAGGDGVIKVKEENEDLLSAAVDSTKTRSVWMNMKSKTDVVDVMNQEDDKLAPSIFKVEYNEGKGSQAVFVSFSEKVKDFGLDGLCKSKYPDDSGCSGENLVKKEGGIVKSADLKGGAVTINLQSKLEPGSYKVSFSKVSDFSGNVSGDISHTFKIDPIVKKNVGEVCDSGGQCVEGLSCVLSEGGGVCGTAKTNEEACALVCGKEYPKCKVVDLQTDPVDVLCDPGLVKVCESDAGCDGGKKCVDVPKEYQEVAGGAKICAVPKGGKCDLNINCSPGLVCSKDKGLGTSACVESECDVCGGLACTSLGDGGGFSSVTCGDVKDTKAPEIVVVSILTPTDVEKDWTLDITMSEDVSVPKTKDFVTLCLLKEGTVKDCGGDPIVFTDLGINSVTDVAIDGAFDSSSVEAGKTYLVIVGAGVTDKAGNPLNLEKNFATVEMPEAVKPKEICNNCEDLSCFGKTDKDGFTCCNDGTEKVDSLVCGGSKFCDNDDLNGSYRCFECSSHTDCAGGYCEVHSCVDAPDVSSVGQGENSGVLKVAFSAPLSSQQFVPDFSVVSAANQAVFQISSVSADESVLTLSMSQALPSGKYIFEAKSIILKSGNTVPLTINNKFDFTLTVSEVCGDKVDNDGDGKKNCLDEDCSADPSCTVGACKVHADCLDNPGPEDPVIYCASVDGGAAQCKFAGDFSTVCPSNPNPVVHFSQQPVFIDCVAVPQ